MAKSDHECGGQFSLYVAVGRVARHFGASWEVLTTNSSRTLAECIAEEWASEGINYAVAHGVEAYPHGPLGRDLDVLVQRDHLERAISLAFVASTQQGFAVCAPDRPFGKSLFAFRTGKYGIEALEMDFFTRLRWGPAILVSSPHPITSKGPFKVDPWASFVKNILMYLLSGDPARLRGREGELLLTETEKRAVDEHLPKCLGQDLARDLIQALERVDHDCIENLAPRIRRRIIRTTFSRHPITSVAASFSWLRDELVHVVASECAPIIAVVGPDGVGKSTVIEKLRILAGRQLPFTDVVIRHWRPALLPALKEFTFGHNSQPAGGGPPRRKPGRFHLLRIAYYFVDFLVGSWLKDSRLSHGLKMVIYDRCGLDMSVDPVRFGLRSSMGTMLMWRAVRKPHMVVLLYDTPERIFERKAELKPIELERQLKAWMKLVSEGAVHAVTSIDAEPEEIAQRIVTLVVESFILKHVRRETRSIGETNHLLGSVLVARSKWAQFQVHRRRRASPGNNGNFLTLSTYRVVPNASVARFLIPVMSRRGNPAFLQLYNAQRRLARVGRTLLSTVFRLRLAGVLFPQLASVAIHKSVKPDSWGSLILQEYLKELLHVRKLAMSVSLGTRGPHQKPLLQLMDHRSRVVGYVKVGWNRETIDLVQREANALRTLDRRCFSTALVPHIIHTGWWQGRYLLVQNAPQSRCSDSVQQLTDRHLTFLLELYTTNRVGGQLQTSDFARRLQQRLEVIHKSGFAYDAHLLQRAFLICNDRLRNVTIPFGFTHGDFTPWNVVCTPESLFVVDWEYAQTLAPPGWDLFHFIIQTAVLVRGRTPCQIYEGITRHGQHFATIHTYLQELRVSSNLAETLLLLYLIDILSWYVCREGQRVSIEGDLPKNSWRRLLAVLSIAEHRRYGVNVEDSTFCLRL